MDHVTRLVGANLTVSSLPLSMLEVIQSTFTFLSEKERSPSVLYNKKNGERSLLFMGTVFVYKEISE